MHHWFIYLQSRFPRSTVWSVERVTSLQALRTVYDHRKKWLCFKLSRVQLKGNEKENSSKIQGFEVRFPPLDMCIIVQAKVQTLTYISFVQVQLKTEILRTPSSTRPGLKLMTSRSWHYISCHWDACSTLTSDTSIQPAIARHSTKKPVTTMLTYPWKCTVLHCNHLGNTWKTLVLMTRHFDYHPR